METAFTSGTRTPFTGLSILLLILFSASACIGQGGNSYKHFIFNNPSIKWAAEYESLVNLSPKTNTISLKKWYLDRLRKQAVKTYAINNENVVINDRPVNMPWLNTQEWLTGHYILPHENILNWEFVSRTGSTGYHIIPGISSDSCCGCDESDAFLVKQLLVYKNARFNIENVLLSPLCARRKDDRTAQWYPLTTLAYNDQLVKTPAAQFLTTRTVTYNTNEQDSVIDFKKISEGDVSLADQIFEDIKNGNLNVVDPVTREKIPYKKLLTWKMATDTVQNYDLNGEPAGYKFYTREIDPNELTVVRLTQKWYFDFISEKLFSEVTTATLMKKVFSPGGIYLGLSPFCEILFNSSKP